MDLNISLLLFNLDCFILYNVAVYDSHYIGFLLLENSQGSFNWIIGYVPVELSPLKRLWEPTEEGQTRKRASHTMVQRNGFEGRWLMGFMEECLVEDSRIGVEQRMMIFINNDVFYSNLIFSSLDDKLSN